MKRNTKTLLTVTGLALLFAFVPVKGWGQDRVEVRRIALGKNIFRDGRERFIQTTRFSGGDTPIVKIQLVTTGTYDSMSGTIVLRWKMPPLYGGPDQWEEGQSFSDEQSYYVRRGEKETYVFRGSEVERLERGNGTVTIYVDGIAVQKLSFECRTRRYSQ